MLGTDGATLTDLEHLDVTIEDYLASAALRWTETPAVLTGSVRRPSAASNDDGSLVAQAERVTVDLQRGRLTLAPGLSLAIDGFRDASVSGDRVRLRGDDRRNYLSVAGCDAVARGGDDNDHLWVRTKKVGRGRGPARLLGQRGNDRLTASGRNDVLIGGPGRGDTAHGSTGHDVCVAEKEHRCERSTPRARPQSGSQLTRSSSEENSTDSR